MPDAASPIRTARILIIGGGFSGVGMAIRLLQRGIRDFVLLERATQLGGTWRDNCYPGCACDVQSLLYSFSFAQNPNWSRVFSPQAEIWEYLQRCAVEFGIEPHVQYGQTVEGARWDDIAHQWEVETTTQQWRAQVVVAANGALSDPMRPDLPGLAAFEGRAFHSSQWDRSYDLQGKRVAVIGTGASAIQFVPKIQPRVKALRLFQRTPPWILPRRDRAIPAWRQSLHRRLPIVQSVSRAYVYATRELMLIPFRHPPVVKLAEWQARRHMHSQVKDPSLRAALSPTYAMGCKRVLLSDDYYPALSKPNVELVTSAITRVHAGGIETADGRIHETDAIIFGTGFRPTDPLIAPLVTGRSERTLAQVWNGSPYAYMGSTVADFPNLFFLLGPNTGLGHTSILLMVEAQIEHVLGALSLMEQLNASAIEPTVSAQSRFVEWVQRRLAPTVWNSGGCRSWYLDRTGRNSALWPDSIGKFRRMASRVVASDYELTSRR